MTTQPPIEHPEGLRERLEAFLDDEGNHVGGVWGDYGEIVVCKADIELILDGRKREAEYLSSGYVATLNQAKEALEVCEARSTGNRDETGLLPGERAALDQLRALRITGDQIDAAIEALGPTGDLAEAYVKVAAGATAAALRALASFTTTPEATE